MNSFKPACSFAKSTPVSLNQLEENIEPCLGRQVSVKLVVSRFGIFKTAEHLNDSLHRADFISGASSTTISPLPFAAPGQTLVLAHETRIAQ